MVDMLGDNMTVIQFLNTIQLPAAIWVILFVLIFVKIGDNQKLIVLNKKLKSIANKNIEDKDRLLNEKYKCN
jgi:hypothetical protein